MDWDDEFDEGYNGTSNVLRTDESMANKSVNANRLEPMGIANPSIARFFQSDDAKDQITGMNRKKMGYHSCGQSFMAITSTVARIV